MGIVSLNLGDKNDSFEYLKSQLKPDDFFLYAHQTIFDTMIDLHAKNIPIDRVTLAESLQAKNKLESIGGISYLIGLDEGLPVLANLSAYTQIVRDKSNLRKIIYLAEDIKNKAASTQDTPDQVLTFAEQGLSKIGSSSSSEFGITISDYIDSFDSIDKLLDFKGRMVGLPTGFQRLDELTGGVSRGGIFCIAGRPGSGKSALMLNIMRNLCTGNKDQEVVIFSPEMTMDPIFTRFIARETGIHLHDLRDIPPGKMKDDERRKLMIALSTLKDLSGLRIDETSGITPEEMFSKLSALRRKKEILAVGVDYFQLLKTPPDMRFGNEVQKQEHVSNFLMRMSKVMKLPFVVLSQLRKADGKVKNPIPQLDDIKGSGALIQDSWQVMALHDASMDGRDDTKGWIDAYLLKNRMGPMGVLKYLFQGSTTTFSEREGN